MDLGFDLKAAESYKSPTGGCEFPAAVPRKLRRGRRKGRMLYVQQRSASMDLKFTQTGKFLIAAGSRREGNSDSFNPVLYISVLQDKAWATQYPMEGRYPREEDAAAAALHYAIQIITRQKKDVKQPQETVRANG